VNVATVWISIAALAVSIVSLAFAIATYRRAGPRIRAKVFSSWADLIEHRNGAEFRLRVSNRGLAACEVKSAYLALQWFGLVVFPLEITSDDISGAEEFPLELKGGSDRTWKLDLSAMLERELQNHIEHYIEKRWWRMLRRVRWLHLLSPLLLLTFLWSTGWVVVVESGGDREVTSRAQFRLTMWILNKMESA
jgi:hypothetical protein